MGKRTETQNPEEEVLEVGQEAAGGESAGQEVEQTAEETVGNGISIQVSQVKDGESKVAETLDEGWEADGVAIVEGCQTLLIVALNESQLAFGGDESQNLEEDVASPSMSGLDGQQRSAFLIEFYGREEKQVPALAACAEYGWLPSGGEMALIFANKSAINDALDSPLLNSNDIYHSKKILLRISFCGDNEGTSTLMMDEMNEVHEFMEKIKVEDVETKWGLSIDPSLGNKVKVTILAVGFGVQDIHSEEMDDRLRQRDIASQQKKQEEDELNIRNTIRRDKIYGVQTGSRSIRRPRYNYIFKDEDLDNDDIISMVEASPTYKRTKETLKQFTDRAEEATGATPTVITGF